MFLTHSGVAFRPKIRIPFMKRFSMFALMLGLAGVLGCEPPKAPVKEAPKAETTPDAGAPTDTTPADTTPKEDMPKDETK
jgi:hypothetical protein